MSLETPKVPKQNDRVDPAVPKVAQDHDPLQAYRMERSPSQPTTSAPKDFLDMHDLWKPSVDAPFNTPKTLGLETTAKQFSFNNEFGTLPSSLKTDGNIPAFARADLAPAAGRTDAAPAAGKTDAAPAAAPGDTAPKTPITANDAASANHVVANNESLWKIAGDALRANSYEKVSDPEIWKSVKDIVSANKQEHPELQKNPDAITPGMKLNMPEELAAKPESPKAETAKGEAPKTDEAKIDAAREPIKLADAPAGTEKPGAAHDTDDHPGPGRNHRKPRHHHNESDHSHDGKDGGERHSRRHQRRHGRGGRRGSRRGSRRKSHDARQERRPRRHEQPEVEGEETEKSKLPLDSKPGVDPKGKHDDGTKPGADAKPGDKEQKPDDHDNPFTHAFKELGKGLGDLAHKVAGMINTKGDCARGPRLTFKEMGYELPPMIATKQGAELEKSGLFKEVPRDQVQPGDYAYRHWNRSVIKQHHGVDKGDSFIVSGVGRHGELYGSNDHRFQVPEDGGRYRNTKFLRPTEEFWKRYGHQS